MPIPKGSTGKCLIPLTGDHSKREFSGKLSKPTSSLSFASTSDAELKDADANAHHVGVVAGGTGDRENEESALDESGSSRSRQATAEEGPPVPSTAEEGTNLVRSFGEKRPVSAAPPPTGRPPAISTFRPAAMAAISTSDPAGRPAAGAASPEAPPPTDHPVDSDRREQGDLPPEGDPRGADPPPEGGPPAIFDPDNPIEQKDEHQSDNGAGVSMFSKLSVEQQAALEGGDADAGEAKNTEGGGGIKKEAEVEKQKPGKEKQQPDANMSAIMAPDLEQRDKDHLNLLLAKQHEGSWAKQLVAADAALHGEEE